MNGIVMYDAFDVAKIVNANDVRMRDLARQQQFALETAFDVGRRVGVGGNLGADHLDRDRDAQFCVPGLRTAPIPPTPSSRMMW